MHVSDGARQRSRMMENEASSRRPVKLVNKKRPCGTTNPSLPSPLPPTNRPTVANICGNVKNRRLFFLPAHSNEEANRRLAG